MNMPWNPEVPGSSPDGGGHKTACNVLEQDVHLRSSVGETSHWEVNPDVKILALHCITLAPSYSTLSSSSAGNAAERAADLKIVKYSNLLPSYDFVPVAFETLGPMNSSAVSFLTSLGRRLSAVTGDKRESAFLFQRLSMSIQRFNSIALHDSFLSSTTST